MNVIKHTNCTVWLLYSCVLYSLDPEQKDILIEVIEKLLADKTTVVILRMFVVVKLVIKEEKSTF